MLLSHFHPPAGSNGVSTYSAHQY
uniref:Uncharacterized protein n=1 Tax=Anopheles minimus TaxID=112268 RepID=A0A182WPM5_9DIPT